MYFTERSIDIAHMYTTSLLPSDVQNKANKVCQLPCFGVHPLSKFCHFYPFCHCFCSIACYGQVIQKVYRQEPFERWTQEPPRNPLRNFKRCAVKFKAVPKTSQEPLGTPRNLWEGLHVAVECSRSPYYCFLPEKNRTNKYSRVYL